MSTLFMPWLRGWRQRLTHILRGHRSVNACYLDPQDWGRGVLVSCSCGDAWIESEKL